MSLENEKKDEDFTRIFQEIIQIPIEYIATFSPRIQNLDNETYKLYSLERCYALLSLSKKKVKKFNIEQIERVLVHLISNIDVWYTHAIVKILLNKDDCRDIQALCFLELVNHLALHNSFQIGFDIIELMTVVSQLIHTPKKKIKQAAEKTLNLLLKCSGNKDLEPFLTTIFETVKNNKNVPIAIEKLAGCVFVQTVEFPIRLRCFPIISNFLL